MNKIKRKIIGGAIIFGSAAIVIGALSKFGVKSSNDAIPVALVSDDNQKPIIVLDAGHGGYVLSGVA